jgi:hypothetical protein
MDLKEILSVSGKSGLFKVITNTKNGLIAESLLDSRRIPVYASDKISNLEEISVFTDDKEVALKDVFKTIYDKESGKKTLDPKSDDKKLKEYFAEILPNYDRVKVYVSDIKKILTWYNILHDKNMLVFNEENTEEKKEDAPGEVKETADMSDAKDKAEDPPAEN